MHKLKAFKLAKIWRLVPFEARFYDFKALLKLIKWFEFDGILLQACLSRRYLPIGMPIVRNGSSERENWTCKNRNFPFFIFQALRQITRFGLVYHEIQNFHIFSYYPQKLHLWLPNEFKCEFAVKFGPARCFEKIFQKTIFLSHIHCFLKNFWWHLEDKIPRLQWWKIKNFHQLAPNKFLG